MTARAYMVLAFAAALAVHGGAFVLWGPFRAQGDAGAGGSAPVTVLASAGVVALVATWERPHEALDYGIATLDAPLETDAPRAQATADQIRTVATPGQTLSAASLDAIPVVMPGAPIRLAVAMADVASVWTAPDEVAEYHSQNVPTQGAPDGARAAPSEIARPRVKATPKLAAEPPVAVLRPTSEDARKKPRPSPK